MAITSTKSIYRIEIQDIQPDPELIVLYTYTFDDPSDDDLPVEKEVAHRLSRYTTTVDDEGEETQSATDVSGHMPLVQSICTAIWN